MRITAEHRARALVLKMGAKPTPTEWSGIALLSGEYAFLDSDKDPKSGMNETVRCLTVSDAKNILKKFPNP